MHSILQLLSVDVSPLAIPVAGCTVHAGFPSPADDWSHERIDLAKLLVPHPACTFFVKSGGLSMKDAGIGDGDLLVVDRYLRPLNGDIVVAVLDSDFTVKHFSKRNGVVRLSAANPTYPDIVPREGQTMEIWGVVTACVKRFRKA